MMVLDSSKQSTHVCLTFSKLKLLLFFKWVIWLNHNYSLCYLSGENKLECLYFDVILGRAIIFYKCRVSLGGVLWYLALSIGTWPFMRVE